MEKDIKKLILNMLLKKGEIKAADIMKATGFSRAYVNRFFQELKKEGKIALVDKANKARYVISEKAEEEKKNILSARRIIKNSNLSEDIILDEIKENSGIFINLPGNIADIVNYAFTEMLNNAIEHSGSEKIIVSVARNKQTLNFSVADFGIGIFRNIMKKRKLKNQIEAIQDLLKGKQTTAPREHTGEGIFFTSKAADKLIIRGSDKKLIFDNIVGDVFIKDIPEIKGTKVDFEISLKSKKNLNNIFREYSGKAFQFSKTDVSVSLYEIDNVYISRSQARRIMAGLEKFKKIVLDFRKVETIGQGFADEVFRVWKNNHPEIEIEHKNANENVLFMIKRAIE